MLMKMTVVILALAGAVQAFAGTIQVTGSSERMVDPDTVVCSFAVSATHKETEKAAAEFAKRQDAVMVGLASAGFTTNEVAMNTVSMTPEFEYGGPSGKRFKGFRYEAAHRVKFAFDRARLARLYGTLAGSALVESFNVEFTCQDSVALMRELRQEAVADAIRKANEYARGFGVVVKGLDQATDAQVATAPANAGVRFSAAAGLDLGNAPTPDFSKLTPQQVRFESTILATFQTEQP
ncbi:MAG: SIMPL domain-containing protein [Kiritimatiellia bacterium]